MTTKSKIVISATSILLFSIYINKYFFNKKMLAGIYVSNDKSSFAEAPNYSDTLILYDNGKFNSDTWGTGTYELKYSLAGTTISISYKYEFGNGGYSTSIYRPLLGKPRIIINRGLESYFARLD
jgi:hypothetical protein